jgi:molybdopterin-synthase adenylyltransferase
MNDAQLLRYSRHLLLPEIGIDGQQKLLDSRVLIVGLGGLGSPVSMYLAASGVGTLALADPDKVDLTNLQRQVVHNTNSVGLSKVASAAKHLKALNPDVAIHGVERKLEGAELEEQVRLADVVVDCCDNFPTRFAINAACLRAKKPLVSAAVTRFEGQIAVFRADLADGPCYRCLYDEPGDAEETCVQFGVLAPFAGVMGGLQATETLKLLVGIGEPLAGKLLIIDALSMLWRLSALPKDPACPACTG